MSERVRIKRGATPKPAKRRPAARPAKAAPARMIRLPVAPARLKRWIGGALAVLAVAGSATALWVMQIPQTIWFETAASVGRAGFEVRHVEVTGLRHMARLPVYAAALNGRSNSMLLVDLDDTRERLRRLPWVADASVARRLPDTLSIEIVERKPVALWQHRKRLAVIDGTGQVLDTKGLERFARLPLLVGADANWEAARLMTVLADVPGLAERMDSATWVSGRRWDLRFKSGETLALPEGYDQARKAIGAFARMDESDGLLSKGFARFDMRLPDKMIVRVSHEPGAQAMPQLPTTGTEI